MGIEWLEWPDVTTVQKDGSGLHRGVTAVAKGTRGRSASSICPSLFF